MGVRKSIATLSTAELTDFRDAFAAVYNLLGESMSGAPWPRDAMACCSCSLNALHPGSTVGRACAAVGAVKVGFCAVALESVTVGVMGSPAPSTWVHA